MKKRLLRSSLLLIGLLLTASISAGAQVLFGQAERFNHDWRFSLDAEDGLDGDVSKIADNDYHDAEWRSVVLPHDWSIEGQLSPTLASCTGYLPGGIGWYRKHFTLEDNATRHYIYFEGVYNRSEVYLNGHLLGKRPNGYISFMYDMTPYLNEGENVLAVRVDHSRYADSRWYTGSGIYRDVWMVSSGDIHFAQWGTRYSLKKINDSKAVVNVKVEVENSLHTEGQESLCRFDGYSVRVALYDANGKKVASKTVGVKDSYSGLSLLEMDLTIKNPKRWNLDVPYLYNMKAELVKAGKVVDSNNVRVGLRELRFDPDHGFYLNGQQMKIKGVCLHHDAGVLGSAVPKEVWSRRLDNLKKIGVNSIRMSHNPQATVVYDLCDEKGLLVMDEASDEWEFPKRKWVAGWNVGKPMFQGSYDFFEEWIEQDVTDMVRRDRNHPSVFLWSIGNEVDYPNDPYSHPVLDGSSINQPMFGGYNPKAPNAERIGKIAKRLAACVRNEDLSRPVTGALAGVVMSNETEYPYAVDVVGYNYTENRYDCDHKTYPDRVIYGSENVSSIEAWHAVRDREFIFGQYIWTGTDYLGESGRWPSRGFYTGLLDFASFCKPRGWFRASLWSEKPVTYIGTDRNLNSGSIDAWDDWNYDEGEVIRVLCYTNAPQARLRLNGKIVGEMQPYNDETGVIAWNIPYESGVLVGEGCDNSGNVLSAYTIQTSGRPYALEASVEKTELSKDRETVHIFITIKDENGVIVKLADNNIKCSVDGPIRLLGLEGCNNSDMSDYSDDNHRAYRGTLTTYLQTTGQSGNVTVEFTSPLLKGCKLHFKVR